LAAFSILTEEAYFKGDNLFIPRVKEHIPHIPILRKDFIYTPFQVAHSKFLGASAILLIVRMLSDIQLQSLHRLAQDLGLDVLVEVHDKQELQRALALSDLEILGINNRNLNTFEVSLATTEQLLQEIPQERREQLIVVGESGYHSKEDIVYAEKLEDVEKSPISYFQGYTQDMIITDITFQYPIYKDDILREMTREEKLRANIEITLEDGEIIKDKKIIKVPKPAGNPKYLSWNKEKECITR